MSDHRITRSSQDDEDTLVNHAIGDGKIDDFNNYWDRTSSPTHDNISETTPFSETTDVEDISSLDS